MKVCKSCKTKNNNRKKKCEFCGASLKEIKIQEDSNIYKPIYKSTNDIVEHKDDRKIKKLIEQVLTFIFIYFIISSIFSLLSYFTLERYLIDVTNMIDSLIYYNIFNLINICISLISALSLTFKFGTIYESDIYKFVVSLTFFFSLYSLYIGAVEHMKYEVPDWSLICFLTTLFIFMVALPVIYTKLKEKLL